MYTDEQKKRIAGMIEAFKGCREYLCDDNSGICWALGTYSTVAGEKADAAVRDAKRLIGRALGNYIWLDLWLRDRHRRQFSRTEMLALRLRWVDQLIADCEAALKD